MEAFTISTEDWREYRKNATECLEKCSQYATRKAIQIAIDKQIQKKPIKTSNFVSYFACPICNEFIGINDQYCTHCGQAIDWT